MSFRSLLVCVVAAVFTVLPARAISQEAWDGLDELAKIAADAGIELAVSARVDLASISPNDALLLVGPTSNLPVGGLTGFLRAGGRVALLDDVGSGDRLLMAYQVTRTGAPGGQLPALRDDPGLLVAYPASEHPLVEGVSVLLTNRAKALRHPELKPVFTFGRSPHALVLAGAVGSGRLVAVGDASLLINQLMRLKTHRRFAKNLLEYLARPQGRVWLIGPSTELEGSYGIKSGRLSRIDAWLKRVAHPDLPPAVLSLIALAFCGIAVALAAGTLPRRSPYVRPDLFPKAAVSAGFAGRIAGARGEGADLVWSLLEYKRELEAELGHRLGLEAPFAAAAAVAASRRVGLAAREAKELSELLARLDGLALETDLGEKKTRIGVSELQNVVRKGEELLEKLGNDRG